MGMGTARDLPSLDKRNPFGHRTRGGLVPDPRLRPIPSCPFVPFACLEKARREWTRSQEPAAYMDEVVGRQGKSGCHGALPGPDHSTHLSRNMGFRPVTEVRSI